MMGRYSVAILYRLNGVAMDTLSWVFSILLNHHMHLLIKEEDVLQFSPEQICLKEDTSPFNEMPI